MLDTIFTSSTLKALSVFGATCCAIVGATYTMITDNSFQIRDEISSLKNETQHGFENVLRRLDKIDEHIGQQNERVANLEGKMSVIAEKKR